MDIKGAIEELQHIKIVNSELKGTHSDIDIKNTDEMCDLAIAALEKQIPKKPVKQAWTITRCPCCGGELGEYLEDGYTKDWSNKKVCDCGQKLDWEI